MTLKIWHVFNESLKQKPEKDMHAMPYRNKQLLKRCVASVEGKLATSVSANTAFSLMLLKVKLRKYFGQRNVSLL